MASGLAIPSLSVTGIVADEAQRLLQLVPFIPVLVVPYRFRGATVENFVDFPSRCREHLKLKPTTIVLSRNYRSRRWIVDFYNAFIRHETCDWRKDGRGSASYRVDKDIRAERDDQGMAVVASTPAPPEDVCAEIAALVRSLTTRYLALLLMFSNRTCAGILCFSKSVSGPNAGQARLPNHAGFSFR